VWSMWSEPVTYFDLAVIFVGYQIGRLITRRIFARKAK
jgi:hypothetical protein